MFKIHAAVEGITPLSPAQINEETYGSKIPEKVKSDLKIEDIKGWYAKDKKAAQEWEASVKAWRDSQDRFCVPHRVIWGALLRAARQSYVDVGRPQKKNFSHLVVAGVNLMEQNAPLLDGHGKPIKNYKVESEFVRRPANFRGSYVQTAWPVFFPWSCAFTFLCDSSANTEKYLNLFYQAMAVAGWCYGWGDRRPEKQKRTYGRFSIAKWEFDGLVSDWKPPKEIPFVTVMSNAEEMSKRMAKGKGKGKEAAG